MVSPLPVSRIGASFVPVIENATVFSNCAPEESVASSV